jgi:hypothetical protein
MLKMDARGWIGFGCFALVVAVLAMAWADKELLKDDFFKLIATAIILTAWINGPVGWAYQATKSGTEAAASSARIAENAAGIAPVPDPPAGPAEVVVVNEPDAPVPTTQEARP